MHFLSRLRTGNEPTMPKLRRRTGSTTSPRKNSFFRLGGTDKRKHPNSLVSGFPGTVVFITTVFITVTASVSLAQTGNPGAEGTTAQESILDDPELLMQGRRGLNALYDMRYEEADSIFTGIEERYGGHPVGPFLRALVVWWRILPNLDMGPTEDDYVFYRAMEHVIELSETLLDEHADDFDAMFFKGAALGFRGRLRSNRRDWLSAAMDGRKTLDYIFKIAESDTSNADFQFGRGVYDYFASIIPERYPIVRPMMIFFPDADRDRGLKNLAFTASEGDFIRTEAAYFLLQIYLFYEPDFEKARTYAQWLRTSYPGNAYFHVLEGRVYARWSLWDRTVSIFRDVVDRYERGQTGYNILLVSQALYYLGRYDMLRGRLDDAFAAFDRIVELSESIPTDTYFRVHAILRRGMILDQQGRRDLALVEYEKVLDMDDRGNSHDRAKQFRKTRYGSE